MVDAPVPGSGKSVPYLVPGGGVNGRGAVVGGEVVLAREPVDGLDLGEDAAGDDRPNTVKVNEMRASALDEVLDLGADGLHLGVEGSDVLEVLLGQLQPHLGDWVIWAQFVQQLLGSVRPQSSMGSARCELGEQPVEATDSLGAQRTELIAAVGQQAQAHQPPSTRMATTPLLFNAASPIETASSTSVLRPCPWE
jgi:hypothetical protein